MKTTPLHQVFTRHLFVTGPAAPAPARPAARRARAGFLFLLRLARPNAPLSLLPRPSAPRPVLRNA